MDRADAFVILSSLCRVGSRRGNRNDPMTPNTRINIYESYVYIYINSINHTIFFFIIFVLRLERDERGVRIDNNFIFYFDF